MGANITNKTKYRLRVSFDGHGDDAELGPGDPMYHVNSGPFAADETWKIKVKFLNGGKWIGGPSKNLTNIWANNADAKWVIHDSDIEPFLGVKKVVLLNNGTNGIQLYDVANSRASEGSSEEVNKIMSTHNSKFNISFGADGLVKAVSISGKAEAEWTSEEKKEAEQIKKEVNEVTHTTGGKITVPAHFCLYGLIRDGQSSPSGYSVEPSK